MRTDFVFKPPELLAVPLLFLARDLPASDLTLACDPPLARRVLRVLPWLIVDSLSTVELLRVL